MLSPPTLKLTLVQMPIWSLTKERIEKLLKQVGDKESEIDELIKLTKEDLWTRDLDEFINEWRFQLDDEAKRQKKVANMGRRASNKLRIAGGPISKKRKADDSDDSDFGGVVAKAKKPAAPKQSKQPGGMLAYLNPGPPKAKKTSPKAKAKAIPDMTKALMESLAKPPKKEKSADVWMDLDSGSDVQKAAKTKAPAPAKKAPALKKIVESDDDDDEGEEIIRPTAGRKPRAAATKPVQYNTLDSDSDGDDMLLDVGNMVKGIDTASTAANTSRPLFSASMSRPGSSAGLPKKPASSKITDVIDDDDTNYSMLAPPSPKKGPALTAKKTVLSDDEAEDSFHSLDEVAPAPKVSKAKPGPKAGAKPAGRPKGATNKAPAATAAAKKKAPSQPPEEPKKMPLSPAAKAYAAKKAKLEKEAAAAAAKMDAEDDEIEQVANQIMGDDDDDDEDAVGGARRPARRAATASKKKWVISDDEDGEEEEEGTTGMFEDGDSDD